MDLVDGDQMRPVAVGQLGPKDQWDQNMLDLLFGNELYPTGLRFERSDGYPNSHGCCLIIPARYWVGHYATITEAIGTYDWVLAFRCGDEEDQFDLTQIRHRNLRWWVQSPRADKNYGDARLFGVGFPPHFNKLPADPPVKDLDVALSAQCTHPRRKEAFEALRHVHPSYNTLIHPTEGFTKGIPPEAYTDAMVRAKVAPAPAGPATADTFRLFEALEAHCVPIADDCSLFSSSWVTGFWRRLFPDAPFPILTDYTELAPLAAAALDGWPANANRIAAWWIQQKRRYAHWLREDLEVLGAF